MYMKKGTSRADKERALALLKELQGELRRCNAYVQDFVQCVRDYNGVHTGPSDRQ